MITGLTMIKATPGREKSLYDELLRMDGIKDVYKLFGEFDFFVIMQADGYKRLNTLADTVRHLCEVKATTQMMISKEMTIPGGRNDLEDADMVHAVGAERMHAFEAKT